MHLRQPPSPGVRPWERNMRLMLHLRGKILISCLTSKSNLSFKTCRPIHHYFPYYCTRSLLGLFSHLGRLDFRHFFRAQSCLIEFHKTKNRNHSCQSQNELIRFRGNYIKRAPSAGNVYEKDTNVTIGSGFSPIGREGGTWFFNQSQRTAMQTDTLKVMKTSEGALLRNWIWQLTLRRSWYLVILWTGLIR